MGILTACSEIYAWETLSGQLTSYAFPLVVLQAAGIYGLLAGKPYHLPKWLDFVLRQIDSCSFGIYLVHMIALKAILVYAGWNPYAHSGTAMVVCLAVLVLVSSFAVIWLLKRIP